MIDSHSGDKKMVVTVAICTWNRAELLDQTLAQMRNLRIPEGVQWELLVVNNNSTDHTDEVIRRHTHQLPLRSILETEQGLSRARNRALHEAKGEVIAFIDDDVLVDPEWLAGYCRAANDWPDAAYFVGPVFPWYEIAARPYVAAVLDELANGAYLGINLGKHERILEPKDSMRGANMAFRSASVSGVKFDPKFGRNGNYLGFGEEGDFCSQLRKKGSYGVWVPGASLQHYVPAARLQDPYLKAFFQGLGTSMVRWGQVKRANGERGVPRWLVRSYAQAFIGKYGHLLLGNRTAYFKALAQQWRLQGIIQEFRK